MKINDYATFNWKAVAQAINVLGGVDIEITQPEFKYINALILLALVPHSWQVQVQTI